MSLYLHDTEEFQCIPRSARGSWVQRDQHCDKMRGPNSSWHVHYVMSREEVGGTPGKRLRVPRSRDKSNGRLWTWLLDVFQARSSLASKIKTRGGWRSWRAARRGGMGAVGGSEGQGNFWGEGDKRDRTWQLVVGRVSHQMTNSDRLMFIWSVTDYRSRSGHCLYLELRSGEIQNMWS